VKYLTQYEVICGFSETNKLFSALNRERFGIMLNIYPDEPSISTTAVCRKFQNLSFWATPWSRCDISYDDFLNGFEKRNYFSMKEIACRLPRMSQRCSFARFDVHGLQGMDIRNLEFGGNIALRHSDLEFIQSITFLESLIFRENIFVKELDTFPPNLIKLYISSCNDEGAEVRNLPDSLQVLDCVNVSVPEDSSSIFPLGLLSLRIWDEEEMSSKSIFKHLPSLSVSKLISLELLYCKYIEQLLDLPSSLRKLKIERCNKMFRISLPEELEEFKCINCPELEVKISSLPMGLKKLTFIETDKVNGLLTQLEYSLLYLEELILGDCANLITLPSFPKTLRHFEIGFAPKLNTIPELPSTLDFLSLSGCAAKIDHIPLRLKTLILSSTFPFRDLKLPNTLKILDLSNIANFKLDFHELPLGLECLRLRKCPKCDSIPFFPPRLEMLAIEQMDKLRVLPSFPDSLQGLLLAYCDSTNKFPSLPPHLKPLKIHCHQVQFIGLVDNVPNKIGLSGKFPNSLGRLDLSFCRDLEKIGELPQNLSYLDLSLCNSKFMIPSIPRHLRILRT
jgi:hypothetical protein